MHASHLLPHLSAFRILSVSLSDDHLILDIAPKRRTSCCPLCSHRARRIHSRYVRSVDDLPCGGVPVVLQLHAHRFFCGNRRCPRRIFCERLSPLVAPRRRRTGQLSHSLTEIGFVLGGEGGSRLAGLLGMTASPASLLRLLRRAPLPPQEPIRILGIDDWAKRKGRSYGTILVGATRSRTV